MIPTFTIRVPEEAKHEFTLLWKQLRLAEGLSPAEDLREGEVLDRFDGAALLEWVVPVTEAVVPLLTAILGFVSARRGEVEYRSGEKSFKFRNVRPRDIEKIARTLRDDDDAD